jgi:MFS family permease
LDNTIIATAIPKITSVFSSLDDVGWYGSSYLLTMTSLQPSFGKIYANFDMKITYLTSLVIFEGEFYKNIYLFITLGSDSLCF